MTESLESSAPRQPLFASPSLVAVVLPPGEGFGPGRAGAIGMIVHRLGRVLPSLVIGGPQAGPVYEDVPFRAVRPVWWWPGNVNTRYAAFVARALRPMRPSLIEVHNRPEIALALARRLPGTPVSLFLHNDPQTMRRARTPQQRAALARRLARVVTVSGYLHDRFCDGLEHEDAAFVLSNPIDLSALPPPAEERDDLILFAGRVVAEKGADVFARACATALSSLPGWEAVIIGADRFRGDSPETPFVREVRAIATGSGVQMVGYQEHPAVLRAMSRAAIVVVPSRWEEPFGLTALEAMACGAALIASRTGGLPEVAGNGAIFVDPGDPGRLAQAIVRLAQDPDLREKLVRAGRARARHFGLEMAAARLTSLRQEIMAAP